MKIDRYVWQKFYEATYSLVSRSSLKDRIYYASLELSALRKMKLPEEIEDSYNNVMEALTREEAKGDEGTFRATLNTMSEDEAETISREILSIYDKVTRFMDPH